MNYAELLQVLEEDVNRTDKAHRYGSWINRGLRKIQSDYSWRCMRTSATLTITAGTSLVSMPDDFKELTPEESPIHLVYNSVAYPVEVTSAEKIKRSNAALLGVSLELPSISVYVQPDSQGASLNILNATDEDLNFQVSYFGYLPDLADDSEENPDENYLTRTYEDLVEARIKATAFTALSDPAAEGYEQTYRILLRDATTDDANRKFSGRTLRMGG